MKNVKRVGGVLLAMTIALCGAKSVMADVANSGTVSKEQEAALREIAYTATLARFVSTNCPAFAAALAPDVRERWQRDEQAFRVKGVQLFLPDFFRVAYVYNGSVKDDVFCFGLFNPFYDHMLLCKARNLKQTEITDYKWVSGAVLRGDTSTPKYPLALGVNPADQYFLVMLKTLDAVLSSFNRTCVGTSPDDAFSAWRALDEGGIERLRDIAVARSAQAIKMTGDKSAYGLATLGTLILRDEKFSSQPFLDRDEMTRAMVKLLSTAPADIRKAFRPVGYFEADGERCVLFYNFKTPRLLALVRSTDGKSIHLGMFDANGTDAWKKVTGKN